MCRKMIRASLLALTWVVWSSVSLKSRQRLPATLGIQQLASGNQDFCFICLPATLGLLRVASSESYWSLHIQAGYMEAVGLPGKDPSRQCPAGKEADTPNEAYQVLCLTASA